MSELIPNPQPGSGRWSTAPQGPFAPVDIDAAQQPGFVVRYESFVDPSGAPAEPENLEPAPVEEGGAEGIGEESPETSQLPGRIRTITMATTRALLALSWVIGRASYQHPRSVLVVLLSVGVLSATALTRPSKSTPPASIAGKTSVESTEADDPTAGPDVEKQPGPRPEDPALAQAGSTSTPGSSEEKNEPTEPKQQEPGTPSPETVTPVAEAVPNPSTAEEVPTVGAVPIASILPQPAATTAAPPETDPAIVSPLAETPAAPAPAPAPTTPAMAPRTVGPDTKHPAAPPGSPQESSPLLPLPVVEEKPLADPATTAAATQPSVTPSSGTEFPEMRTHGDPPTSLSSEKPSSPTTSTARPEPGPPTPGAAGKEPGPPKAQAVPGPETTPSGPPLSTGLGMPSPEHAAPAGLPKSNLSPAIEAAVPPPSEGIKPSVTQPQPASQAALEKPHAPASKSETNPIEKPAKDHTEPPAQIPVPAERPPQSMVSPDGMTPPADISPALPMVTGVEERPVNPISPNSEGANKEVRPGLNELPEPGSNGPSPTPGPEIPTGPSGASPLVPSAASTPTMTATDRVEGLPDSSPPKIGESQPDSKRPVVEAPAAKAPPKEEPKHEIKAPAENIQPKDGPGHERIEAQPALTPVSTESTKAPSISKGSPNPVVVSPMLSPVSNSPEKPSTPLHEAPVHRSQESPSKTTTDGGLAGSGWVRVASKGHLSLEMTDDRSEAMADERGGLDSSAGLRGRFEGPATVSAPDRPEVSGGPTTEKAVPKARETAPEPTNGHPPEKPHLDSTIHVVERGENFWTISRLYYGSARYYRALWKANSQKYPNIQEIHINDVIEIPAVENLDPAYIDPSQRGPVAHRERDRGLDQDLGSDPDRSDSVPTSRTARSSDIGLSAGRPMRSAPELELPVGDLEPDDWTARIGRAQSSDHLRTENNKTSISRQACRESSTEQPVYKVRDYDTLRSIARDLLGDPHRAEEIYELNRDVIGDPNRLAAGTLLELPEDANVRRMTASDRTHGHH